MDEFDEFDDPIPFRVTFGWKECAPRVRITQSEDEYFATQNVLRIAQQLSGANVGAFRRIEMLDQLDSAVKRLEEVSSGG